MSGSEAVALEASGFGDIGDRLGAPLSSWLRTAIAEAVRREPLLATEDAIMLVDIVIALSRQTITMAKIISNPMLGRWLKKAVIDNRQRPSDQVLRDTEHLRNLLIVNLLKSYRNGQLRSADSEIRVCNIIDMIWGVGKTVLSPWSRQAAARVRSLSEAADGGLSVLLESARAESDRGHDEMAEIFEQMSWLSATEVKGQLSMISESLSALGHQLQ